MSSPFFLDLSCEHLTGDAPLTSSIENDPILFQLYGQDNEPQHDSLLGSNPDFWRQCSIDELRIVDPASCKRAAAPADSAFDDVYYTSDQLVDGHELFDDILDSAISRPPSPVPLDSLLLDDFTCLSPARVRPSSSCSHDDIQPSRAAAPSPLKTSSRVPIKHEPISNPFHNKDDDDSNNNNDDDDDSNINVKKERSLNKPRVKHNHHHHRHHHHHDLFRSSSPSSSSSSPSPMALMSSRHLDSAKNAPAKKPRTCSDSLSLPVSSKLPNPIPSSKMASRIYAFHTLFSRKLPDRKPDFLSDDEWHELLDCAFENKLVSAIDFHDGRLSVRLPVSFDIIIHSMANYGLALKEYTPSASTRFRWWTDSSIPQLKVSNRNVNKSIVERTIQLPDAIVSHPFMQSFFRREMQDALFNELTDFFTSLLKRFLHPDDFSSFEEGIFGRSRKRPRQSTDSNAAFDAVVGEHIDLWNAKFKRS